MSITLRIRSQLGTWRLKDVSLKDTMAEVRSRVESENKTDLAGQKFTTDPADKVNFEELGDSKTIADLGFKNGSMVWAMVDESKAVHRDADATLKTVTKDGQIIQSDYDSQSGSQGFRPGMRRLRDMKMQWTLNDFIELDEQFEYKMKKQAMPFCSKIEMEKSCAEEFQNYVSSSLDFQQIRVAYLYGNFRDKPKSSEGKEEKEPNWGAKEPEKIDEKLNPHPVTHVEFIYEPPQDNTDSTFELLEDSQEALIESLAANLGMVKVGWIIAHPLREKGFNLSGSEVIEAAEQQLLAKGGVGETPFITIRFTIDPETDLPYAEGYQMSQQCMEMAAEGVLEPAVNPGYVKINDTFTAYVELKPVKTVDIDFFLNLVPIGYFDSDILVSQFPRANRLGVMASREDVKRQLSKAGQKGWTFQSLLSDFQLLLYLCQYLDPNSDLPIICRSVLDKSVPLDEGHTMIIRSLAGLD